MKKYMVGAISGLAVLVVGVGLQWPDGKVHMIACDVGQGDGIVVTRGFTQVVVDGGPNQKIVDCVSEYMPFWDRRIELMVMTNGDADHMTGLIDILKRYKVDQIIANNLVQETERFKALREGVIKEGVGVYGPKRGDVIKLAGVELEILWPEKRLGDELVWEREAKY